MEQTDDEARKKTKSMGEDERDIDGMEGEETKRGTEERRRREGAGKGSGDGERINIMRIK